MTSTIGWLDASAAEQRRVQEIVRMFSQSETVDELGGRQAFVAIADELFPGTSVPHSRARYLIFIPWLCRRAAANPNPRARLDRLERTLIGKFLLGPVARRRRASRCTRCSWRLSSASVAA